MDGGFWEAVPGSPETVRAAYERDACLWEKRLFPLPEVQAAWGEARAARGGTEVLGISGEEAAAWVALQYTREAAMEDTGDPVYMTEDRIRGFLRQAEDIASLLGTRVIP